MAKTKNQSKVKLGSANRIFMAVVILLHILRCIWPVSVLRFIGSFVSQSRELRNI